MYFEDLEKAFDRIPRKVLECAMMKKGIPEVLLRSVMSLLCGSKENSQNGFYFIRGVWSQDAPRICFVIFLNKVVVGLNWQECVCVLRLLLCADGFVLMSKTLTDSEVSS